MANFTPRLNLRKPDPDPMTGDDVDIQEDLNANWDKVDDAVAAAQDDITALGGQVTTINGQITTLTGDVSTLDTRVDGLEGAREIPQNSIVESATPSSYPLGLSLMSIGSGSGWSVNNGFGIIATFRIGDHRTAQLAFEHSGNRIWRRAHYTTGGWTPWHTATTGVEVIKRGWITTNESGIISKVGIIRLDNVPVQAGMLYRVSCHLRPFSTVSTDSYRVEFHYNTSGVAVDTSPQLGPGFEQKSHYTCAHWVNYAPSAAENLSILLTLHRAVGTGTFSSNGENYIEMLVECLGPTQPNSGVAA